MSTKSISVACFDLFLELSNSVRFTGCNVFEQEFSIPPNFKTYFTSGLVIFFCFMSITSIYRFADTLESCTLAILTFGLSIQGIVKVFMMILDMESVRKVPKLASDFAANFENNHGVCRVFQWYIGVSNRFRKYTFFMYVGTVTGAIVCGLVVAAATNSKVLPFGAVLPLIDHESDFGYVMNYSFYFIMSMYGAYGLFASDYLILTSMIMACAQVDTIAVTCEDLSQYLEVFGAENDEKVTDLIKTIIKTHQMHIRFMRLLHERFSIHSFAIIVSSMICIAIASFVLIKAFWINGILMIVLFFWQLVTVFSAGGVYMARVEDVQMKINTTSWHLLPVRKQKMFLCIIQNFQFIAEPSALSLFSLNFETFVTCLKIVYQFLMLLFNFSD
uniref:Odorant receptor n=1 Tax=Lutzomyia longipalpis TaxID=7200 RepID=A0A3F2ZDE4_LUTLO